ncbi:MAG: c-type cytochrome [Snowella sp.]|nr:c-type cytochrome [Snowella sp.]
MKKKLTFLILTLSVALAILIFDQGLLDNPTLAANTANGAKIFKLHCMVCHLKERNMIIPGKDLTQEALAANEMDNSEAIIAQVTNGKNAMPSFRARLRREDIQDVAAYVLEQAANDWK